MMRAAASISGDRSSSEIYDRGCAMRSTVLSQHGGTAVKAKNALSRVQMLQCIGQQTSPTAQIHPEPRRNGDACAVARKSAGNSPLEGNQAVVAVGGVAEIRQNPRCPRRSHRRCSHA